ncbi:hypothetical protein DDZ13_12525 [Coraliomargarita sinensis]|uniref:Uncharacterized protein n=1 Tax=Coraliomargarita sinensis TaxID=2174842 RepID=A0A317ZDA7_9BACT|nr:hypothetical protein DDZ13_12525 [Coraliomargarita sinensis]
MIGLALLCGYSAAYYAWAHTAPPDTHNDYYERMHLIYFGATLACILSAALSMIWLWPKQKTDSGSDAKV